MKDFLKLRDVYNSIKDRELIENFDVNFGGKSFDDETYADFIFEADIGLDTSLKEFNEILFSCGLKEI